MVVPSTFTTISVPQRERLKLSSHSCTFPKYFLSPGYADYVGSAYEYYAHKLAAFGITSIGFDYPGFGRSEGRRGYELLVTMA